MTYEYTELQSVPRQDEELLCSRLQINYTVPIPSDYRVLVEVLMLTYMYSDIGDHALMLSSIVSYFGTLLMTQYGVLSLVHNMTPTLS